MVIAKYSALFLLSTIKFLFAPFGGPKLGFTFFETYFSCVIGAVLSATVFFFLSDFLMKKSQLKLNAKRQIAEESGVAFIEKKKFTKTNRFIIKIKRTMGIYGMAMYVPLFFSIPLGVIITAKFYGKNKMTYPIIILGIFLNGFMTTSLAYLIFR